MEDRPEVKLHTEDARPFLRRADPGYDAIFVDAYRQPYIPFYLATVEFFDLAREKLGPGGVLVLNVGHPEGSDRLEKVLAATLRRAIPNVARDPITDTNTLLIASVDPAPSQDALRRAAQTLPGDLRPLALRTASRLAPALRGGAVYTDDRAPVEWLIDKSLLDYAGDN